MTLTLPPARSPTPCSTRAICSIPTAPRRRRTRCAGSSACSGRPGAAEAGVGEEPSMSAEVVVESRRRRDHRRVRAVPAGAVARRAASQVDDGWEPVDELLVGGTRWIPFHEAVAREVPLLGAAASTSWLAGTTLDLEVPAGEDVEELREDGASCRPAGPHPLGPARHRHRDAPVAARIRDSSCWASGSTTAPPGRPASTPAGPHADVAARYFVRGHPPAAHCATARGSSRCSTDLTGRPRTRRRARSTGAGR